jgi:2-polyprenyl-6-methoxyphenol hydroxylase-like FAD-dependent oxidoreductase
MHLLTGAGLPAVLERTDRPRLPAIMLSETALALIRDVFDKPGLFRAAHRITRRVVQWGRNAEPRALDHAAVVVSEPELLGELQQGLEPCEQPAHGEAAFTIFASRPLPEAAVEHCFGSRTAHAAQIRLVNASDSSSCWIESLEAGWLFLIPNAADSGWLLSVGCSLEAILQQSTLIAGRVASVNERSAEFPASPRIVSPLSGPGWLACGTAGMAFDPICGDGTANAVREAILASAVVKAIAAGGEAKDLLQHYEARLILGFQRHLASSLSFYQSGHGGSWWDTEAALLKQGLEWCAGQMRGRAEFRYQLRGFDLMKISI